MSATARIKVTLDLPSGSSYGPEWTIGAMEKQVREEAIMALRSKLREAWPGAQIVGDPVVTIVQYTAEKQ